MTEEQEDRARAYRSQACLKIREAYESAYSQREDQLCIEAEAEPKELEPETEVD